MEVVVDALLLTLPIVVGGVLHMLAVAKDWLSGLKIPVHTAWFGPNKTWRGFVLMPALTLLGMLVLWLALPGLPESVARPLSGTSPLVLGLALGLGYVIMELPNSFIKRRLGIPAGETPGRFAWLFILVDQWDSAIGFGLAYALLTSIPATTLLIMVLLFPLVALFVKRLLYMAKWKEKYV